MRFRNLENNMKGEKRNNISPFPPAKPVIGGIQKCRWKTREYFFLFSRIPNAANQRIFCIKVEMKKGEKLISIYA